MTEPADRGDYLKSPVKQEPVKEKPVVKSSSDLNNDGVVDKKDKSLAAKVLATGKKIVKK